MYTRASASDYDDFQAKGWTTKELIPLMKKHETYQRASHNGCVSAGGIGSAPNSSTGTFTGSMDRSKFPSEISEWPKSYAAGGVSVAKLRSTYPVKEDFLRAAESQGIPVVDDLQDLTTGHGAEHWLKWINRDVRESKYPLLCI